MEDRNIIVDLVARTAPSAASGVDEVALRQRIGARENQRRALQLGGHRVHLAHGPLGLRGEGPPPRRLRVRLTDDTHGSRSN